MIDNPVIKALRRTRDTFRFRAYQPRPWREFPVTSVQFPVAEGRSLQTDWARPTDAGNPPSFLHVRDRQDSLGARAPRVTRYQFPVCGLMPQVPRPYSEFLVHGSWFIVPSISPGLCRLSPRSRGSL